MLDEPYPRSDVDSAPSELMGDGASVSPAPRLGQVESVPSELLWRAAILAARQAAVSAAELRRALQERTPPVPPPDGGAARLMT
jgi:hypothetical protein